MNWYETSEYSNYTFKWIYKLTPFTSTGNNPAVGGTLTNAFFIIAAEIKKLIADITRKARKRLLLDTGSQAISVHVVWWVLCKAATNRLFSQWQYRPIFYASPNRDGDSKLNVYFQISSSLLDASTASLEVQKLALDALKSLQKELIKWLPGITFDFLVRLLFKCL
jgi:hypothetical protein